MAEDILKGKTKMSIKEFFEILDCVDDEMNVDDKLNDVLYKIKDSLQRSPQSIDTV